MLAEPRITRRHMLAGTCAGALWPATALHAAPAGGTSAFDLDDPATIPAIYVKIRGDLSAERVAYLFRGHVYAVLQDGMPIPLAGVTGVSFSRFRRLDDGSYECRLIERGYYLDSETGEIRDELPNPITGGVMVPKHIRSGVQTFTVKSGGEVLPGIKLPEGAITATRVWAPAVIGDEVHISEDLMAKITPPAPPAGAAAPVSVVASMATYRAKLADLQNAALSRAPATLHLQTAGTFAPWMAMGNAVGKSMWRASSVKLAASAGKDGLDAVPATLLARIAKDHPGFLDNPL